MTVPVRTLPPLSWLTFLAGVLTMLASAQASPTATNSADQLDGNQSAKATALSTAEIAPQIVDTEAKLGNLREKLAKIEDLPPIAEMLESQDDILF